VNPLVPVAFAVVRTHHPALIHKEVLCPRSGDINRLMMMMFLLNKEIYPEITSTIPIISSLDLQVYNDIAQASVYELIDQPRMPCMIENKEVT
jgi:hypothetical protein